MNTTLRCIYRTAGRMDAAGRGTGAGTPVLELEPVFQASPRLDHEESTAVVFAVAAKRAVVAVSYLKSDTGSPLTPIKVNQCYTCK